jgi:hypothetical protein
VILNATNGSGKYWLKIDLSGFESLQLENFYIVVMRVGRDGVFERTQSLDRFNKGREIRGHAVCLNNSTKDFKLSVRTRSEAQSSFESFGRIRCQTDF